MLYDREKKTTAELMPTLDGWVDEFSWAPDSQHLLFVSGLAGDAPYGVVAVAERSPGVHDFHMRSNRAGEFSELTGLRDFSIIAVRMLVDRPAEIVRIAPQGFDAKGRPLADQQDEVLTHVNDAVLGGLDLGKMEPFWFAGAGGMKVEGFVLRPPGFDPARKYPVKFLMHGGPQGAWGNAWSYRWNPELFAADGYVVVMVNPRGSTGYGQAFIDGVNGDWGGKPYVDLVKGLDAAEAKYPFIDRTRSARWGRAMAGSWRTGC